MPQHNLTIDATGVPFATDLTLAVGDQVTFHNGGMQALYLCMDTVAVFGGDRYEVLPMGTLDLQVQPGSGYAVPFIYRVSKNSSVLCSNLHAHQNYPTAREGGGEVEGYD